MARARSRRLAFAGLVVALTALLAVRPGLVLAPIGRFLVGVDPPVEADAVVVLAGGPLAERAFGALGVYRSGRALHVVLSQDQRPPLADTVERLGIRVVLDRHIDRQLLEAAGVPASAVELLPPAENTLFEARAVARLARERGWSSVIVVTSKFHSRRACWTFRRVLGEAVRVHCQPTPYDRFDPERWWQDDKMALQVASEYLKLGANFLSYGLGGPPDT